MPFSSQLQSIASQLCLCGFSVGCWWWWMKLENHPCLNRHLRSGFFLSLARAQSVTCHKPVQSVVSLVNWRICITVYSLQPSLYHIFCFRSFLRARASAIQSYWKCVRWDKPSDDVWMSYVKRTLLCMTERVCSCSESTMEWTSELLSPCQFGCLLNESQRWLTTFYKWRKMHLKICLRMLQIIFLFLKTENIVPRKAVSFAIKMHLSNSYLSSKFLENLSGSYGRRWWWWWWQRQTLISRCEAAHSFCRALFMRHTASRRDQRQSAWRLLSSDDVKSFIVVLMNGKWITSFLSKNTIRSTNNLHCIRQWRRAERANSGRIER